MVMCGRGTWARGFVALCFLWVRSSGSYLEGLPQSVHPAWGASPFGGPMAAADVGQYGMVWLSALLLCSAISNRTRLSYFCIPHVRHCDFSSLL